MNVIELVALVAGAVIVAAFACWAAVEVAVRHVRRRRPHHRRARPGGV